MGCSGNIGICERWWNSGYILRLEPAFPHLLEGKSEREEPKTALRILVRATG